jgi:hypothetical protein
MKDLKDTVDLMLSDSHKNRLAAEYWQTKIRYDRLRASDHTPLKEMQEEIMKKYLDLLRARAEYENVNLHFSSV